MKNKLIDANYEHYEISSFAKKEFKSKHNSGYWMNAKYMGVGPSAHSFNGFSRQWNIRNNSKYIDRVMGKTNFFEKELVTPKNRINEYLMTRLRTDVGINLVFVNNFIKGKQYGVFENKINNYKKRGLIIKKEKNYILTSKGMFLSNRVISDLFII